MHIKELSQEDIEELQNRLRSGEIFVLRFSDIDDDAHCIPTDDNVVHIPSLLCECGPRLINSFDSPLQVQASTVIHRTVREILN